MTRVAEGLSQKVYDVLVIGGGINGAGIAHEAARQGLTTLLLERADFGSGTTSRSSKLIHGGLRYLEHGEWGLVFESLRERQALLRIAPHLIRPLSFLILIPRESPYGPRKVRLGLFLYDLLAAAGDLPSHRSLSRAEVHRREPALVVDEVRAAFLAFDAQVISPERLVVENVRAAVQKGADVLNYAEVVEILSEGGEVRGVRVRDRVSGREHQVRARVVINAAGPWVDAVLRLLGRAMPRYIGGTRGSHLVVPNRWGLRHALYTTARADGRPFFLIPWRESILIGTTDIREEGDPDQVRAGDAEIAYLVEEGARLLTPSLTSEDVLYVYSGVRPLPYSPGVSEGAITRRHLIRDHEREEGVRGIISLIGGKITPYRQVAREVLAHVAQKLRRPEIARRVSAAEGSHESLPGGAPFARGEVLEEARSYGIAPESAQHVVELYGSLSAEVLALVAREEALGARFCPHNPDIAAQIVYAVEREWAVHLADVLLRRTLVGWSRCLGRDCAPEVARIMAAHAGWDERRMWEEIARYHEELNRVFRVVAHPSPATRQRRAGGGLGCRIGLFLTGARRDP